MLCASCQMVNFFALTAACLTQFNWQVCFPKSPARMTPINSTHLVCNVADSREGPLAHSLNPKPPSTPMRELTCISPHSTMT